MAQGDPPDDVRDASAPDEGGTSQAGLLVRHERPGDAAAIAEVIAAAFRGHPSSQGRETGAVARLRRDKALVVSLVAQTNAGVAGHIAFSRVIITGAGGGWYGLGPLAVAPSLHKRGIGQLLVRSGLEELRAISARGCVLLGDPGFYGRFGFRPWPGLMLEGAPPEHVLGLPFGKDEPAGEIAFHSAFYEADPTGPGGAAAIRSADVTPLPPGDSRCPSRSGCAPAFRDLPRASGGAGGHRCAGTAHPQ